MSFFNRSFYRPGPGIDKDAPRKKGISRFLEICSRDFLDLVKLNLLFCMCCLPSAALFAFSLFGFEGEGSFILFLLSIVCAFPVGGAMSACFFCITRRMRDDPSFIWFDFKRKFKENYVYAIPAGIFCTVVFYAQFYLIMIVSGTGGAGIEAWMLFVNLIILILLGMIVPYFFLLLPYFHLSPSQLLRNSMIMFAINTPRSFMGSVQGGLIWALYAFLYPFSIFLSPFIILVAFSMSWLLTLMWIWKPVNEKFKIEEALSRRQG